MARFSFIPHDQDREDQREEDRLERKAARKLELPETDEWLAHFEGLDPEAPEFASVEALAEDLLDTERTEFLHTEMACVNYRTGRTTADIRKDLEGYGFTLKVRKPGRNVRGFKANPHDRFSADPFWG